jgi:hypothetical protein
MIQSYKKSLLLFPCPLPSFLNIGGLISCWIRFNSAKNCLILTNFGLFTDFQPFNDFGLNALLNNNAHFVTMIVTDSQKRGGICQG